MRYEDYKDMVEALATVFNEDPQIVWRIVQDNPPMTNVEVTHVADAEEGRQMDLDEMIRDVEEGRPVDKEQLINMAFQGFNDATDKQKFKVLFDACLRQAELLDATIATVVENHENDERLLEEIRSIKTTLDSVWEQAQQGRRIAMANARAIENLYNDEEPDNLDD